MKSPDGLTGGLCCVLTVRAEGPATFDCRRTKVSGGPARSTERSGRCSRRAVVASRLHGGRVENSRPKTQAGRNAPRPRSCSLNDVDGSPDRVYTQKRENGQAIKRRV